MTDELTPEQDALFEQVRSEIEQYTPDDERRMARIVGTYTYRNALLHGENAYEALTQVYEAGLRQVDDAGLREFSVPGAAPRVEAVIEQVMARYPGIEISKQRSAKYFEEVHQALAPLARSLEQQLHQALRQTGDLALLVGRLVRELRRAAPHSHLPDTAVDYLRRMNLVSPLREGDAVVDR